MNRWTLGPAHPDYGFTPPTRRVVRVHEVYSLTPDEWAAPNNVLSSWQPAADTAAHLGLPVGVIVRSWPEVAP
jgi:hypothetical protein